MFYAASRRRVLPLALLLLGAASPLALAQSANVALENITVTAKDKGTTLFKRIDVTGTNLTKDELSKLFSGAATKEEAAALGKKMKAEKVSIPEAVFTEKDSTVTLRDFTATGINEGRIASVVLKSAEGKGKAPGGAVAFKAGALEIQGLAFASALSAMSGGDLADGSARIGKISFAGFEMTAPDEATKPDAPGGNLYKISLASFTAEATYDGETPLRGKGEAKSLIIEPPKGSDFGKALASFGYDKLNLGLVFSGNYDKTKKTYDVDNVTVSGVSAGSLTVKTLLAGIDPAVFTASKEAKLQAFSAAAISSLSLRYDNAGLFEKSVDYFAKQSKKTPAALKQEWAGMTQIVPMMLGGDPAGGKLAEAASKFIAAPKNITISAKAKGAPLSFSDLAQIKDPPALLKRVDIDAAAGQ